MKITASNYIGREQNPFSETTEYCVAQDILYYANPKWLEFEDTVQPYPVYNKKGEPVKEYSGEAELVWQFRTKGPTSHWANCNEWMDCEWCILHEIETRQVFIISEPEKIDNPDEVNAFMKIGHSSIAATLQKESEKSSEPEPGEEPAYYGRVNTSKMFTPKEQKTTKMDIQTRVNAIKAKLHHQNSLLQEAKNKLEEAGQRLTDTRNELAKPGDAVGESIYTKSQVVDLLVSERQRAMSICNSFREKYMNSYKSRTEAEAQVYGKGKANHNSVAFIDRERAEIARFCANAISSRTGLNTGEPLTEIIEREYFDKSL